MAIYRAPLRDMRFVLYELHRGEALSQLPGLEEMTPDLIDPVLEQAAKFSEVVLQSARREAGAAAGGEVRNGVRCGSRAKPLAHPLLPDERTFAD